MGKFTITSFRGLTTNVDQLEAPVGGLSVARNVSLERAGGLQPHRGTATQGTVTDYTTCHRLWEFQGQKMGHFDDGAGNFRLFLYDSVDWVTVSSSAIKHPDNTTGNYPLHEVELNDWLYLAEYQGIRRLRAYGALDAFAGAPKCPDMDRPNSSTPDDASGVLGAQKQRAYKALIEIRKNDGDRILTGAPSGRLTLQNTNASGGSNKAPTVRVLLPKAVNTESTALTASETWVQLYASSITDTLAIPPLEDFALIYDHQVTSTNITNGYVDIPDTTPDVIRGQALYTNPTQETSYQANEPPPFAFCLARYKECLVAANLIGRERFELQILAVGGSNGIQDTDTITVETSQGSPFTITAKTTPAGTSHYQLETSGSLSTSQQIEYTAQNIVAAINRHASNTVVYAFYAGIPDDPRSIGKIIIENREAGNAPNAGYFTVYVGSGDKQTCFEPQLPTSSSLYVRSRADEWSNGWAISKRGIPDAWPLLQNGRMGKGNVIAIGALEDACFCFHASGDVWRMTGDPPTPNDPGTLAVEPWRENLELIAPKSIQVLDGRLIAYTNQGVVGISPGGYQIISEPIARDIAAKIASLGKTELRQSTWSVVDPVSRRYILGFSSGTDLQFVFHAMESGWTTGNRAALSAGYYSRANDKIFFGKDTTAPTPILSEDVELDDTGDYGDSTVAITSTITLPPFVIDGGETAKQLREVQVVFEANQPSTSLTVTITTEHTNAAVTVANQSSGIARVPVPQTVQRGARHTVSISIDTGAALSKWRISAVSYLYRAYSERASK